MRYRISEIECVGGVCGSRFQLALSLLDAIIMSGVNGVIAMHRYWNHVCRAQAVSDLAGVSRVISKCMHDNPQLALGGLANADLARNREFSGGPGGAANLVTAKGNGNSPSDKKCRPVKSDFDFYGVGIGGPGKVPYTSKENRGDVIRAREGKYVGLASAFHR